MINHLCGKKTGQCQFKIIELVYYSVSKHNAIQSNQPQTKHRKNTMWRQNNMLSKRTGTTCNQTNENKTCIETTKLENTIFENLWNSKMFNLREKMLAIDRGLPEHIRTKPNVGSNVQPKAIKNRRTSKALEY